MPDKFPSIDPEELDEFMRSGKGNQWRVKEIKWVMTFLHKNADFREAIESGIGQELLREGLERLEVLHAQMLEYPLEIEERVEFDFLMKITQGWSRRIKGYLNVVNKIKSNS